MLKYIVAFLLMFVSSLTIAQQKQIVIVLDNSGSMQGVQCDYANYSLKTLAALLDVNEFSLKVVDQYNLTTAKDIQLQNRFRQQYVNGLGWSCNTSGIYAESIETAVDAFKKNIEGEKWMVIISDGESGDTELNPKVASFTNNGGRIIYINTDVINNSGNYVTEYLRKNIAPSQLDVLETNYQPQLLSKSMDYLARTLLAADSVPMKYKFSGNSLTINTPLPLKSLTILEQKQSATTSEIISALQGGKDLTKEHSIKISQGGLSGNVHRIIGSGSKHVINSGEITVNFSAPISEDNITIIAQPMADVSIRVEGDILSIDDKLYKVCSDEVKLTISVVTSEDGINWHSVDKSVLSKTQVKIEYLKKSVILQLSDTVFVANIKMESPYFPVSLTARYQGFFNIKRNAVVLDRDTCSVGTMVIPPLPTFTLDELNNTDFNGFQYYPRIVVNGQEREVTPEEFKNLKLKANQEDGLDLVIKKNDDDMSWFVKPAYSSWCQCFFREGKRVIELEMVSDDGKIVPVKKELEIEITHGGTSLWERCRLFILGVLAGIILIWYIWGIYKKRRFSSGAMIEYWRESDIKTRPHPQELKTHFVNRWLVPYLTESNTVEGITFKAGARSSYVEIPMDLISENMSIGGVPVDMEVKFDYKLSDGEALAVSSGRKTEYYKYVSNANQ